MIKWIVLAALAASVSGCGNDRESRWIGDLVDPYCMPDGSTVAVQYSNSTGGFEPSQASKENCPWYKP